MVQRNNSKIIIFYLLFYFKRILGSQVQTVSNGNKDDNYLPNSIDNLKSSIQSSVRNLSLNLANKDKENKTESNELTLINNTKYEAPTYTTNTNTNKQLYARRRENTDLNYEK